MNKVVLFSVLVFFILSFFVIADKDDKKRDTFVNEESTFEKRAVYISYIEFNSYIKGKDSNTSKENIRKMLDNVKEFGFNTVIVHTRPFADSIYESDYYPISDTVLNDKGSIPDYDILEFFIEESHKRDLFIEAWINPFRVSNLEDLSKVSVDSPYYKFAKTNDAKVISGKGIYLNPASSEVQKLVINGIKEIVSNYDIDGIHFDDYFYPDKTIDLESYEKYKNSGSLLSIDEYRRNNISSLIKSVYSEIKNIDNTVSFGIAPEGNIENNYNNNYLDVYKILSEKGYVDYIMPQIYFGFENQYKPFISTLDTWNNLILENNIKLIPALAFYKIGLEDKYAGTGSNEWVENSDIIKKQILLSRNENKYGGFSLFRYDYIFNSDKYTTNTLNELENIRKVLY